MFGNCDTDRATCAGDVRHRRDAARAVRPLELDGVKLAFLHGDDRQLLHDLEHGGEFDFLFHGHTHVAAEHRTGPTRGINPGALHRARPKSFAVLDTKSGLIESVQVD